MSSNVMTEPRPESSCVTPFGKTLEKHGLALTRGRVETLQLNIGLRCNQSCRHCHLAAGPNRPEIMSRETMDQVLSYAGRVRFSCVDITGGAPELNPELEYLIEHLASLTPRLMLRSNLTALAERNPDRLLALCREQRVVLISSLPSTNLNQTEAQRGKGVFGKSIEMLTKLNRLGYGRPDSGLELHLVANPSGAFLPAAQCRAEEKFRADLARKYQLAFNRLYTFANIPLGRFRKWLKDSGNFEAYLQRLAASFNPATVNGLMCRTQISVAWDGLLYDCDFNLAAGLPYGARPRHVTEMSGPPVSGTAIANGDYCYGCTAGSGFT